MLYMLTRYVTYGMSFFVSMYAANRLGPYYYGVWGYLMLLLNYFNLINFGIIPIEAYITGNLGDEIRIDIENGECLIENITASSFFKTKLDLTNEEFEIIKKGGII